MVYLQQEHQQIAAMRPPQSHHFFRMICKLRCQSRLTAADVKRADLFGFGALLSGDELFQVSNSIIRTAFHSDCGKSVSQKFGPDGDTRKKCAPLPPKRSLAMTSIILDRPPDAATFGAGAGIPGGTTGLGSAYFTSSFGAARSSRLLSWSRLPSSSRRGSPPSRRSQSLRLSKSSVRRP